MKKGLLFFIILGLSSILGLRSKGGDGIIEQTNWQWPDSIVDILIVPDSLLFRGDSINNPMDVYNPEQKKLALTLTSLMLEYTEVVDNRMIFNLSREEFLNSGIHEAYYDQLVFSCNFMNQMAANDTLGILGNQKERWEESKREISKQMNRE